MIRPGSLAYRVLAFGGLSLIRLLEGTIRIASGGRRIFFDPRSFPWIAEVEARTPRIREELRSLLEEGSRIPGFPEISEEQRRITRGDWKSFLLYAYGRRIEENCRRCPETDRTLSLIPGMTSAMFSILAPGVRLTPHRGPFSGVLRYHLALVVPKRPGCGIRVGEEVRSWTEGESLVFDDTIEHEAWNETDEVRVVLFVDFLRRLPFPLSVLNRGMIRLIGLSPFVRNMVENVNAWNRRVTDLPG